MVHIAINGYYSNAAYRYFSSEVMTTYLLAKRVLIWKLYMHHFINLLVIHRVR